MPNQCYNEVCFLTDNETFAKIKEYVRSEESEFDFNKIVPVPNLSREELSDWYYQNWGTKWNAVIWDENKPKIDEQKTFCFETAWCEPQPVLRTLSEVFPDVLFYCRYSIECYDEGIDVFHRGKVILDYGYSPFDDYEVEPNNPEPIGEMPF